MILGYIAVRTIPDTDRGTVADPSAPGGLRTGPIVQWIAESGTLAPRFFGRTSRRYPGRNPRLTRNVAEAYVYPRRAAAARDIDRWFRYITTQWAIVAVRVRCDVCRAPMADDVALNTHHETVGHR